MLSPTLRSSASSFTCVTRSTPVPAQRHTLDFAAETPAEARTGEPDRKGEMSERTGVHARAISGHLVVAIATHRYPERQTCCDVNIADDGAHEV